MFKLQKLIFALFLTAPVLALALSTTSPVIGPVALDQNANLSSYVPQNLKHAAEVIISRNEYVISYNQDTRVLNWAAWKLEASDIGQSGRTNMFMMDQDLQNYLGQYGRQAVTELDFKGSCFDRGHQVPSGDRTVTKEVNQMTFMMSNMIPQTAYLNRSIWEHLESYTRDLVLNQGKKVYIIAGPIFDEDFGAIGPNHDIQVPSKNFKVIIVLDKDQGLQDINSNTQIISVIMPNRLKTGAKPLDNKDELCLEANPPPKPKPDVPVTPTPEPQPAPQPTPPAPPVDLGSGPPPALAPVPAPTPEPAPANPPVQKPRVFILYDDWKQFQVGLDEIEKLSGFKIAPQQ